MNKIEEHIPEEMLESFENDVRVECQRLLNSGGLDLESLHAKGDAVVGKVVMATAFHNLSADLNGQMRRLGLNSELTNLRNF